MGLCLQWRESGGRRTNPGRRSEHQSLSRVGPVLGCGRGRLLPLRLHNGGVPSLPQPQRHLFFSRGTQICSFSGRMHSINNNSKNFDNSKYNNNMNDHLFLLNSNKAPNKLSCSVSFNVLSGVSCPDGWTESGRSCYLLSTDYIRPATFASAAKFCEDLGSILVEINNEEENAVVVAMAEEAAVADNNVQRDYWIGGVRGEDGTWRWQSGDPMDYTNWCANCPDDC